MKLFTFTFSSPYMDGFYQAIADREWRARELLSCFHCFRQMELVSEFTVLETEERIVYSREIENPDYEG